MMTTMLFLAITMQAAPGLPVNKLVAPNLVVDGSLEGRIGNNGLPSGWETNPQDFRLLEIYPQWGGRTGERSLRMRATGDWASVATPRHELKREGRQAARVWFRPREASDGTLLVYLTYFTETGGVAGTSANVAVPLKQITANARWLPITVEHDGGVFDQAKTFNLTVAISKMGDVLVDDLEVFQFAGEEGQRLLPNGNMEQIVGTVVSDVSLKSAEGAACAISAEHERPHGGWSCLRLSGKATSAVATLGRIPVPAGKTIRGSGWLRAMRGSGSFKLTAIGPSGTVFTENIPNGKSTPNETEAVWRETHWKLTSERLGPATHLIIEVEATNVFDLCVDDVRVWVE